MVVHYSYQLKFPFGASFQQCPKYLIIKALFSQIKKLTCINTSGLCHDCPYHKECIYYLISGEHFKMYPGILIKRAIIEKKNYNNTQILNIDIYFFHSLLPYEDYIKAFFETNNLLFEQYYQIISFKKMILKEGSAFSGTIKVETPLQRVEDLAIQIEYYNHIYQTTLIIPSEVQWLSKNHVVDERYHTMNRVRFQLGGNIGTMKVNNLDKALFYIGIGKTNFIGGGTISEIKD